VGSYGSGRWQWHEKKITVEQCVSVDIAELNAEINELAQGEFSSVEWTTSLSGARGRELQLVLRKGTQSLFLDLYLRADNASETIELQTTSPHYGGLRWWFMCPISCCNRRVRKLYHPPGSLSFGCRRCLNLTYTSCQESHQRDTLYAHIAEQIPGATPATVRHAVRRMMRERSG